MPRCASDLRRKKKPVLVVSANDSPVTVFVKEDKDDVDDVVGQVDPRHGLGHVPHGRSLDGRAGHRVERQRRVDVVDRVQHLVEAAKIKHVHAQKIFFNSRQGVLELLRGHLLLLLLLLLLQ